MGDFNLTKSIALTQSMINLCSDKGGLNYMKCLKLMYLCERQMYESFRKFITYDSFVSMRYGPVLSNTYNFMIENNNHLLSKDRTQQYWNSNIERNDYFLSIPSNASNIAISLDTQEKIVVTNIAKAFGTLGEWDLVDIMHEVCAEWHDTDSSIPISEQDIASAVHNETAEEIYRKVSDVHAATG